MRRSIPAIAVCLAALLMASTAGAVEKFKPAPGCKKRWSEVEALDASLKGERKVPYDHTANPLKACNAVMPLVTPDMKRTGERSVAIIVFDVTGSGRVVGQQVIGQKSQWAEQSQKALSEQLYEPFVEDDIGVTRVGITMVFIAEFEGRGQPCGKQGVKVNQNYTMFICASR